MQKKKKKGNFTQKDCKIGNRNTKIFINEDLTQQTYKLFKESLKLKNSGYQYIWHKHGNVYVRQAEGEPCIFIKSEQHISYLLQYI